MHKNTAPDYDNISELFWKGNGRDTCQAIFNFCKSNIPYKPETTKSQTVKSPGQILLDAMRGQDHDCKHYASFCNGIIDSLHRKGYPISCQYRFASDDPDKAYPIHVFSLVKTEDGYLWLDPVLDYLNQYHRYYFILDKKPKTMSLYSVNGVGDNDGPGPSICGFGATYEASVGKHKGKGLHIKLPHIKIQPGKLLAKVAMAPSRNAFLVLLKLNAFDLAYQLFKHAQTDNGKNKIRKLWEKVGGKWKNFAKNINQGMRVYNHHHHKQMPEGWHTIGFAPAAIPAAAAAALPVIKVFMDLFKQLGINVTEIQKTANGGMKILAINHNASDDGTHGDGTETEATKNPDGSHNLAVNSFQGNQEENDEPGPGMRPGTALPAYNGSPGGGLDPDEPDPDVQKDVSNKIAEKQADQEIPDAKTPVATSVNVVTDWAKGVKNFVTQNKGLVITGASILGLVVISRSPLITGKKSR